MIPRYTMGVPLVGNCVGNRLLYTKMAEVQTSCRVLFEARNLPTRTVWAG